MTIQLEKKGRKVTGMELGFWAKDDQQLEEAERELERSRVGRKARREGRVEEITETPMLPGLGLDDEIPY